MIYRTFKAVACLCCLPVLLCLLAAGGVAVVVLSCWEDEDTDHALH